MNGSKNKNGIKRIADPLGQPFIGGELNFTADFIDIHSVRLLCCEMTFAQKWIKCWFYTLHVGFYVV